MTKEERENWIELKPRGSSRPLLIPMKSDPIYHIVTGKEVGWFTPKHVAVGSDGSANCPAAILHLGLWRKLGREEGDRFGGPSELASQIMGGEQLVKKPLGPRHLRMKVSDSVSVLVTEHFVRVCWFEPDEDKRLHPTTDTVVTLGELAERLRELAPAEFEDFWNRRQLPARYITHDVIE